MNFLTEQITDHDAKDLDYICSLIHINNATNVGTYTGRSAFIIAERTWECLYCIDTFEGSGDFASPMTDSYAKGAVLEAFLQNLDQFGRKEIIKVLKKTSLSAAKEQRYPPLDLVFLDADHRYSQISKDIAAWLPLIRKGGIICGHDFECHAKNCDQERMLQFCEQDTEDGLHYGVIRAVSEALPNVIRVGRCWYSFVE